MTAVTANQPYLWTQRYEAPEGFLFTATAIVPDGADPAPLLRAASARIYPGAEPYRPADRGKECTADGQVHWHLNEWSRDCDGDYERRAVSLVRPRGRLEGYRQTEEGYESWEHERCAMGGCELGRTQRDFRAESMGY